MPSIGDVLRVSVGRAATGTVRGHRRAYEANLSPTPHAVSRLSANGSPTVPVLRIQWALGEPLVQRSGPGLEPHQRAESGEDVVGSHGRGSVP